jgi:hypothetical protein
MNGDHLPVQETRHDPQHLERLRQNRQSGSLTHLTDYGGGETQITIFDDRYNYGYVALCVSHQMAEMVKDFLRGGDFEHSEAYHLIQQEWFPGAFGETPFVALTNLSAKLDALTIEQYADIFGAGMDEDGRTAWSDMHDIPHFTDFHALEQWFWIK